MRLALATPPPAKLDPMVDAYDQVIAAKRRQSLLGLAALLLAVLVAGVGAEVDLGTFWDKLGNFGSYFERLTYLDTGARVWTDPVYWFWGLGRWIRLLGETVMIAYVATFTGALAAVAGAALASRNISPFWPVRFAARRVLEFARTVPDIVFALIFVVAFGLGALPGVLAITVHTAGALGKLFSEVIENVDMNPVDGVASTGASWMSRVRWGVLPQVVSNFASYALLRFEINVRGATVIGFVGAGGIGETLITAVRKFYYADVSAMLLMLVASVIAIDWASEKLRHRLLGFGGGH